MADESGHVRLIEPMFLMNGRPIEQELCPRAPPSDKKTKEKDAHDDDAGIDCAVRERKSLHRQPIAGTCVEELAGLVALSATLVGAKARAVGS